MKVNVTNDPQSIGPKPRSKWKKRSWKRLKGKSMVRLIGPYRCTNQLSIRYVPSYIEHTDIWYIGVYQYITRTRPLSDLYVLSVLSSTLWYVASSVKGIVSLSLYRQQVSMIHLTWYVSFKSYVLDTFIEHYGGICMLLLQESIDVIAHWFAYGQLYYCKWHQ